MSRLPITGADDGIWGEVLNDYLSISHNADGSLKDGIISSSIVQNAAISESKLDPALQTKVNASTEDATSTSKGIIQLAGELGGTASNPTVPGLNFKYTKPGTGIPESDLEAAVQAKLNSIAKGRTATVIVAASNANNNSKDGADYICDGINDEAEINAALADLPAYGGKIVLSEGIFNIASSILVHNDNAMIIGAGTGQRLGATQTGVGTKLQAVSGVTTAIIQVQRAANDRPVYGVLLRDFTVDGGTIGSGIDGILYRSNRGHIDHVHVHKCTGNGIRILGYSPPANWDTYDTIVTFSQMADNIAAGILFDADAADDHLVHCILYNNNDNIVIKGASQQITGCHTYNAARYNIFFDGGGSRTKIINCKIEGAGHHAVNIDSTNGGYSDIQITGNGFSTNGDSADNTYDHIIIQGPSSNGVTRTVIVGNSFGHKNSVSPNKARYGVNLNSSCAQGTVILSNSFAASSQFPVATLQIATAPINNNGSNTTPAYIRSNANAFDDPAGYFVNVKEAPYNARGNGTTDDTAAIQAALDSLPVTGGIVYLPPGKYEISSTLLITQDNTTLIGSGAGNRIGATQQGAGSRIEAAAGVTGSVVSVQRTLDDRTVYGVKIQDIGIDGDSVGSNVDGLFFRSIRGEIHNVSVKNCTGNGIRIKGYASWKATSNKLIACDIGNNNTAGVFFDTDASDNIVNGNVLHDNQDGMVNAQTGQIVNACDFLSNTRYGLFLDNGGSRSRFIGCRFRLNANHGVVLDSNTVGFSDVAFVGCGFETNGTVADNTYDHIIFQGLTANALSRIILTGCNFSYSSGSSPNKPRYGVNLTNGASQHTVVEANSFGPASHFGTSAIRNSGSGTNKPIVRVNTGWITENSGTATVPSGGPTSVIVTHGLAVTPSANDILISPTNSMGSATKFWVNTINATTFTINV